jgi:hypothetical protein
MLYYKYKVCRYMIQQFRIWRFISILHWELNGNYGPLAEKGLRNKIRMAWKASKYNLTRFPKL